MNEASWDGEQVGKINCLSGLFEDDEASEIEGW
jgi:hypothetical protein